MSALSSVFTKVGKIAIQTVATTVVAKVIPDATKGIVNKLRNFLIEYCQECYATPNPADDVLADFLVEIFKLEFPAKKGE